VTVNAMYVVVFLAACCSPRKSDGLQVIMRAKLGFDYSGTQPRQQQWLRRCKALFCNEEAPLKRGLAPPSRQTANALLGLSSAKELRLCTRTASLSGWSQYRHALRVLSQQGCQLDCHGSGGALPETSPWSHKRSQDPGRAKMRPWCQGRSERW
jgi:hypothetical protein